ncbi:hypothetical protein VN97_g3404 [Penicillium thymicola]|uniref:Calcineurin-like phosphoesterase domain-containing protein n=1 Tax=Penicillium thymicola TaxID=293382 RepID=A0AAI9XAU6_PENTH|nr:hypothetical protein VN97_g3404 [Penicillium thymicola]
MAPSMRCKRSSTGCLLIIAGNHDLILDETSEMKFLTREGLGAVKRKELDWTGIHYLQNEAVSLELPVPASGEQQVRRIKIYGSPMTPGFGLWAFQYPSIRDVWTGRIPDDTIFWWCMALRLYMVTVMGRRDRMERPRLKGMGIYCARYKRVRPKMVVCGHIHGAFGVAVIQHDGIEDVMNGLQMRWEDYDVLGALKQSIWSKITMGWGVERPEETLVINAAIAPSALRSEDKSAIVIDFH